MKVGLIGHGYWGPNVLRNFVATPGIEVSHLCDLRQETLDKVKGLFPKIQTSTDYGDLVKSSELDAVAIVTPVFTHFDIAKKALQNGKHIFVEKPFTSTVQQAEELIELAEKKKLTIMVDHTFLFTGAVRKIKSLVEDDTLGDLYYYDSTRVNLGLFQRDINVIWDLAPHDLSIMNHVLKDKPVAISAHGMGHLKKELEDVAYVTVFLENNVIAHFNFNWLSPVKIRSTLIGGKKKMLIWNDLENDEKIKIYDKGIEAKDREGVHQLLVSYRSGDMHSPRVDATEALKEEARYFYDCIDRGTRPFNGGTQGLEVVKMLEACDRSIRNKGEIVSL